MRQKYQIKYWILSALALLFSMQASASINRIVAVVNDHVITQSQLEKQVAITQDHLKHVSSQKRPPRLVLRRQTLNQLINRQLQLQEARRLGIEVNSQELAKALANMAHHKNKSVAQLYQAAQEDGYSKKDFQKEVHDEILVQKAQRAALGSKIEISHQDVKDYIHSHRQQLRHLVQYYVKDYWLKLPDQASQKTVKQVRQKAHKVYDRLSSKQISSSQLPNEVQVNDMGWQKLDELPTPFVPKLVELKPNHYSKPIKTGNGFHILYLKGKKSPYEGDLQDKIMQKAKQALFQEKLHQALVNWIAKLRSQAYIKVIPPKLKPILNHTD